MRSSILLLAGLLFIAQVQAEGKAAPKFGDWEKKCEKSKEGQEVCYIEQTASDKKTGKRMMQIKVGYVPEQADPIMLVTVPLGGLLQAGVAYFMNDEQLVKMPYLACNHGGCTTVGQKVPSKVIGMMRKGNKGEIRIMLLNRQIVSMPVSLKGFTAGFKAIRSK